MTKKQINNPTMEKDAFYSKARIPGLNDDYVRI